MSLFDRRLGLAREPAEQGLVVTPSGVSLAGAPLLAMTERGLAPRPLAEIERLAKAAYGGAVDPARLRAGLAVAAEALNRDDIGRAMVAALHLRLPPLSWRAAEKITRMEDGVAKYSPDQPRDRRGRWTDGDGGGTNGTATQSPRMSADIQPTEWRRPSLSGPWRDLPRGLDFSRPLPGAKPIRLDRLGSSPRPCQGGGNFPPEFEPPSEVDPPRPEINAPNVPVGHEPPGQIINGRYYPGRPAPLLPNGEPWPLATIPEIKFILDPAPGGRRSMKIFVPTDGFGPMLIGSNRTEDFRTPEGYSAVELSGIPQENGIGDREATHADMSVAEALRLIETRQFSMIFFNRTMSTVTGRVVQSNIRPDVYGVLLPNFRTPLEPIGRPSEVMSGRQVRGYKDAVYRQLGVHEVTYKILMKILISSWNQSHVRHQRHI